MTCFADIASLYAVRLCRLSINHIGSLAFDKRVGSIRCLQTVNQVVSDGFLV